MAERLLEKETISLPDIVEVLGPRPFPSKASLLDYLEELKERINEDEIEAAKKAEEETAEPASEEAVEDKSEEAEDKNGEEKEQKDK